LTDLPIDQLEIQIQIPLTLTLSLRGERGVRVEKYSLSLLSLERK